MASDESILLVKNSGWISPKQIKEIKILNKTLFYNLLINQRRIFSIAQKLESENEKTQIYISSNQEVESI